MTIIRYICTVCDTIVSTEAVVDSFRVPVRFNQPTTCELCAELSHTPEFSSFNDILADLNKKGS